MNFVKLRQYFCSSEFREFSAAITDIELSSVLDPRVHLFRTGHYLRKHNDRSKNRRVAYILYLTPDWKYEYGGTLSIMGKDQEQINLTPRFNSLLLFDVYTQKEHYINPVLPAAGKNARATMSAWLNSDQKIEN